MATQLQLVNSVLRRLREPTVSTVTTSIYSKLIAELLNEAKREVEDAWDWLHLRRTIIVDTVAGTYKYTLTGAGSRARILRDYSTDPVGWDVVNNTKDYNLWKATSAYMTKMLTSNSVQTGDPLYFDVNGQSSAGDPQVDLWPIPGDVQRIQFNMVIPQADFAIDGTDDNTALIVPSWPVLLKTYALALSERGEDGGTSQSAAEARANAALWDAIQLEMEMTPDEQDARVR